MDQEVPGSRPGGGTIHFFALMNRWTERLDRTAALFDGDGLTQNATGPIENQNLLVFCHDCVPIGSHGERGGLGPVGQGDAVRQHLWCGRETDDKQCNYH